jgi:isocitrate dehydrogenase (NAD+)
MNLNEHAAKIEQATLGVGVVSITHNTFLTRALQTIAEGATITGDLGGKASTKEYTRAIIDKLSKA